MEQVGKLLETLASRDDKIWPTGHWPRMQLDKGLSIGSKGGHGPIRYHVIKYTPQQEVKFQFIAPRGFHGFHGLDITSISEDETELTYTIEMKTDFKATLQWIICIQRLHDALTEEAFDKIENQFSDQKKFTKYPLWVKFWRAILKKRKSSL